MDCIFQPGYRHLSLLTPTGQPSSSSILLLITWDSSDAGQQRSSGESWIFIYDKGDSDISKFFKF